MQFAKAYRYKYISERTNVITYMINLAILIKLESKYLDNMVSTDVSQIKGWGTILNISYFIIGQKRGLLLN